MRLTTKLFITILIGTLLMSCGLTPKEIKYDDNELKPLWTAISEVRRDTLGFTSIDKNADISIEGKSILFEKPYDKMLHIYGKTSRTIAFRKINDEKYIWIGEQETFEGPKKYKTVDGEFNEEIVITYHTEPISGHKLNQINISYRGPDERLNANTNLGLVDVRPIINEWTK